MAEMAKRAAERAMEAEAAEDGMMDAPAEGDDAPEPTAQEGGE